MTRILIPIVLTIALCNNIALVLADDPPTVAPDVIRRCSEKSEMEQYFLKDFTKCSGFHLCIKGEHAFSGECANSYFFNEKDQRCDYSHNVQCEVCDTSKNNTMHRTAIKGTCADYLLCLNNEGVRLSCAPGLVFKEGPFCEPDTAASPCVSCPTININNVVVSIPNPTDCTKYFTCTSSAGPTPATCTDGQIFDTVTMRCGLESNGAVCIIPPGMYECRRNEIHKIPVEADCTKFQQCFRGTKGVEESCPDKFIFDKNDTFDCIPSEELPENCKPSPVTAK